MTDMLKLDISYYGLWSLFDRIGVGRASNSRQEDFKEELQDAPTKSRRRKRSHKKKKKSRRRRTPPRSEPDSKARGRGYTSSSKGRDKSPGIIRFVHGITGTGGIPYLSARREVEENSHKRTDSEFRGPFTVDWVRGGSESGQRDNRRASAPPRGSRPRGSSGGDRSGRRNDRLLI